MPSSDFEIEERFGSRRDNGGTIEYLYWARGPIDEEDDLKQAVFDEAPTDHDGIDKAGVTDWEQQGNDLWFATVSYPSGTNSFGPTEPSQSCDFDTSSGTQHITTAFAGTETVYSLSDGPPDFGKAINVDEDGNVNGVDIGVKAFDFSITRKVPIADVDTSFLQTIYDLSWTYNRDATLAVEMLPGVTVTFPAGTILFKGARGGGQEGERLSITYLFSFSPNIVGGGSGEDIDGIPIPDALGWQYMWVYRTMDVKEGEGGKQWFLPKARAIIVDDVYLPGDLTLLGLD